MEVFLVYYIGEFEHVCSTMDKAEAYIAKQVQIHLNESKELGQKQYITPDDYDIGWQELD